MVDDLDRPRCDVMIPCTFSAPAAALKTFRDKEDGCIKVVLKPEMLA